MLAAYDYETEAIEDFPNYPPKPVGLSITIDGQEPRYYAFGHPVANNSTEEEAREALSVLWTDPSVELVAHNNPFDNLVAHKHWGFDLVPACTLHDTMVMCFLLDPHAKELGLKPQAEAWLGLPPEERDAVKDWLISNGICRDSKHKWGAHICKAPGDLVGKYANGDTLRTIELYKVLRPKLEALGMWPAYQREMALQPIMLENTVEGINVNADKLAIDIAKYDAALVRLDQRIFELLEAEPFNLDSAQELADAIDRKIPDIDWPKTPTGKRSTSKATMELVLGSLAGELLACLQYRASVHTCVNTFMRTWLRQATEGDGRIHCQWHTTRSDDGGARTGRLSSSPNFQNIPTLKSAKFQEAIKLHKEWLADQDYPALPNVREYILADSPEHIILDRDFSSQELRVLAHYEDGDLLREYRRDPNQDLHQWACDTIKELTGIVISRKQAKTCIAAGELVLTDRGLVPIEEITCLHAVWDGVQYVRHTGLLSKGLQKVITYGGLTATPDHEVWTNEFGKVQFGFAAANRAMLTRSGEGWLPIRVLENCEPSSLAQSRSTWWAYTHVLGSTVRQMFTDPVGTVRQYLSKVFNAMQELLHYETQTYACPGFEVSGYTSTLRSTDLPAIPPIWGARDTMQVQINRRVSAVCCDELTSGGLQYLANRPYRQRRALRAWESTSCYQSTEPNEQANKCLDRLQRSKSTAVAYVGPVKDRLSCNATWAWPYNKETSRWPTLGGTSKSTITARWAEVYDIGNAGPRNRFTVSGKLVSNCAFAVLYGSGLKTLAAQMGSDLDEAQTIKSAYFEAIPGIAQLSEQLKARVRRGEPIKTFGGRLYHVEPPKYDFKEKRWKTYDYKMLNVLIQGSSADITKDAVIAYHRQKQHGRLILTVHDEIVLCVLRQHAKTEMQILRRCMESIPLDAPLLSEGKIGENLHNLEDYHE